MIIGLAPEQPVTEASPMRWAGVVALAVLIHLAPMMLLTLSAVPLISDDIVMTVNFSDESLAALETPSQRTANVAPQLATPPSSPAAASQPPKSAASQALPKPPEAAKPPLQKPAPPQAAPPTVLQKVEEPPKLKKLDLEPFEKPSVAFDESKATKEVPADGYLSDRNSTAADKGPKDLPRGDPFMDKGESKAIRYQERRGEGGLPALESADTSGSVKKEGNPDAGKGINNKRPADLAQPKKPALPENVAINSAQKPQLAQATGTEDEKISLDQREIVALQPSSAQTQTTQPGKPDTARPGAAPGALPTSPRPAQKVSADERAAANKTEAATPPEELKARSTTHSREQSELDAFKALIDGKGKSDGRGGNTGGKTGINARPGSKGHEGDGTLRPGHDDAVSDVTTINLESSAAEFDEARFAKKFDAKTAYVKPLARRIDGKWKAERIARTRFRPISGVVTMKIVMRKDGKLLEASEVNRTKGVPDEYVASAKLAIERASEPLSEPFPPALAERESIEFQFNFIY